MRGGPKLVAESYLRFNVTGITGVRSKRAKLRVQARQQRDGRRAGGVHGAEHMDGDRASSGPTGRRAARRWSRDAAKIAANATVEYDVTAVVSGNGTYTFVLVGTSDDGVDFASRQNGTSSKRPRLLLSTG